MSLSSRLPCPSPRLQVAAADALLLAAAVEANSEHPLASAVVGFAQAFFQQQQQQQNGQLNGGTADVHKGSSSVALPLCRDVAVSVGQGISAWVQLPPLTSAPPTTGSNGSAVSDAAQLASRNALLRLQLAAVGSQAAGAASAIEGEALALEAAAAGAPAPAAEVQVAVGSRRLMAAVGLGVPPATEAHMHEQEVGCGCSDRVCNEETVQACVWVA